MSASLRLTKSLPVPQSMYVSAAEASSLSPTARSNSANKWVQYFTSSENRHALPLFTSLLNTACGYMPAGIVPYNHLIFQDTREELVEVALQVLITTLDQDAAAPLVPGGGRLARDVTVVVVRL